MKIYTAILLIALLIILVVRSYSSNICFAGGKCTGSAYCTACKNCSRCAHCSAGGSCGVCAGVSSYSSNRTKQSTYNYSSSYGSSSQASTPKEYMTDDELIVTSQTLNLRSEPNTSSEVVLLLSYHDRLIFKESKGNWLYVQEPNTGDLGYVFSKYVE